MSLYEQLALLQRQITDLRRESEAQKLISKLALLDEDDMASDSATAAASQQSIKAYADSTFGAYTAWTDYTPTTGWVGGTTNPTSTTVTDAKYCRIGNIVHVDMLVAVVIGSGNRTAFQATIPVTAHDSNAIGVAHEDIVSADPIPRAVRLITTGALQMFLTTAMTRSGNVRVALTYKAA